MSAQHTPGPWRADLGQDGRWHVWEETNLGRVASTIEPDWHAEANARLIAAAPDLLAACLAARDQIGGDPNVAGDLRGNASVRHVIDAAIARATGGEP